MNIERKFVISCKYFGGYEKTISINDCETIEDIIKIIIDSLHKTLQEHSFHDLVSMLDEMKPGFHIHDFTIESILLNEGTYYICNDYQIGLNNEVITNNKCFNKTDEPIVIEDMEEIEEIEEMLYNQLL